jgi:hypothetical protein
MVRIWGMIGRESEGMEGVLWMGVSVRGRRSSIGMIARGSVGLLRGEGVGIRIEQGKREDGRQEFTRLELREGRIVYGERED